MLRWMASFEDFARGEAVVVNATGLADVLAELRRAWVDDEPGALPESPEEAAELLLLAQISGNDGVEDVYLQDEGVAQVILTVRDEGSVSMLPFIVRLEQYLADYPPPFGTAAVTGTVQLAQTFSEQLVRSFGPSLMLAILLVFGVMTHMFRSVRLGALAVVPNQQHALQIAERFMASVELQRSDALLPFGQPGELEAIYMPEADFSVRMPALTHRSSAEVEVDGRDRDSWTYESRGGDARYRIRVIAFDGPPPEGVVQTLRAQLSLGDSAGPTSASGFPGHIYERRSETGEGEARIYVTAGRVYIVDEAHRRGASEHASRAGQFFDSFRIH